MFPLGHSFEYLVDEQTNKYTKFQQSFNPSSTTRTTKTSNTKPKQKQEDDHEVVLIPPDSSNSSPVRSSTSTVHVLAKSRLVWCIGILVIIFIVLSYQSYVEYMRQIRLLSYMDRVDELKLSMAQVKHHVIAATIKLKEIRQIQYNSSVTLKWSNL